MSWEHIHYRAVCNGSGHEGVYIHSSDGMLKTTPTASAWSRASMAPSERTAEQSCH